MNDTSLNDARVEDRCLITAVMHRYCNLARENADFAGMSVLYTENARIRLPDGTVVGPTQMGEVVKGDEAKYIRHHATTLDIEFANATEAVVTTMFLAITNEAVPDHWGRWDDKFVKQDDGRWLIDERALMVEGANPDGWLARVYQ
ncbi:nuclear transport factor 2 family protein [Rhodococcoides fascians]|uniref:nuclear transport factor 2 family protein n=1 Tax=Rhodococcoides fascians TaxID=1828 RepID=UPI000AB39CDC|nr:nuclear transport factor 2 family protein [Rhodococcus fascians]